MVVRNRDGDSSAVVNGTAPASPETPFRESDRVLFAVARLASFIRLDFDTAMGPRAINRWGARA